MSNILSPDTNTLSLSPEAAVALRAKLDKILKQLTEITPAATLLETLIAELDAAVADMEKNPVKTVLLGIQTEVTLDLDQPLGTLAIIEENQQSKPLIPRDFFNGVDSTEEMFLILKAHLTAQGKTLDTQSLNSLTLRDLTTIFNDDFFAAQRFMEKIIALYSLPDETYLEYIYQLHDTETRLKLTGDPRFVNGYDIAQLMPRVSTTDYARDLELLHSSFHQKIRLADLGSYTIGKLRRLGFSREFLYDLRACLRQMVLETETTE